MGILLFRLLNHGIKVSGYNVSGSFKHSTDPLYLQFAADNASVFYYNQSGSESGRDSNTAWLFKFTKQ